MRSSARIVVISLTLIIGLVSIPAAAADAGLKARTRLTNDSTGEVALSTHAATGRVRVAHFEGGGPELNGNYTKSRGIDFIGRYGAAFGIEISEVGPITENVDALGKIRLSFNQLHGGVPVLGAVLRLHFSPDGEIETVNGSGVPSDADLVTEPTLPESIAHDIARSYVEFRHGLDPYTLEDAQSGLWVYNRGLVRNRKAENRLVWSFEMTDHAWHRDLVLIDAHSGLIIEHVDLQHRLNRIVHHQNMPNPIWSEGDPQPYSGLGEFADTEVNNLITISEETFDLFSHLSGGTFLSWDGEDGIMHNIYDSDEVNCPNATSGNGVTRYCPGTATDDIIAHEWTHGFTESTHGLIYLWQSGALNESYSDIFGEVVDLLNHSGNDEPGTVRETGTCSAFTHSSSPLFTIDEPAEIAGDIATGENAAFNPPLPWTVEGTIELVDDGVGNPHDGCQELVGFTPGNIAMSELGACLFQTPTRNAEAAGAAALVIGNPANNSLVRMSGDGTTQAIPAVFIGNTDRQAIVDHLGEGVHGAISLGDDGSWRWLVAEDSQAFGGAIRDMWTPGCMGHPGQVGESAYWCSEEDNGGVHINSGVSNHAFSLLVDGGEFNGYTIGPIGMTKAAHVYWRAMSVYQTLATNFAEHADLLELSCSDLVGQALTDLATGGPSGEVITQNDCNQVVTAMAAVEMRLEPIQCNFQPLLDPNTPPVSNDIIVFSESFDSDPGGTWAVSNAGSSSEWISRDWLWTDDLPEEGDGGALLASFARDPDPCGGGIMHIDSPLVTLPEGTRPILTFDHWVGTSPAVEGGVLMVAANDGPFIAVDRSDFIFNRYNGVLEPTLDTNPLAGQPAFTGFDGGELSGSWGQSQVDLSRFAGSGDTIRIRFDTGISYTCYAGWGWYVDNVRIVMTGREREGGGRVAP